MAEEAIKAKVTSFKMKGDDRIAITASPMVKGSITVSLKKSWIGPEPQIGDFVRLAQLHQTDKGWRSEQGRLWSPSDEQS